MTAATEKVETFRGPQMVSVLTAPEAALRGYQVEAEDAGVLAPERMTLVGRLPCHTCVREPTCYIRAKIGPRSLDVIFPEQPHPALKMHVTVDPTCEMWVPTEDVLIAEGRGSDHRPLKRTLFDYAVLLALGAISYGLALHAGWVPQP